MSQAGKFKDAILHEDGRVEIKRVELDSLRGIVGGYLDGVPIDRSCHAYVNDTGRIDGQRLNVVGTLVLNLIRFRSRDYQFPHSPPLLLDPIFGPIVILGADADRSDLEADVPERVVDLVKAVSRLL